jgi:hypothetical protein
MATPSPADETELDPFDLHLQLELDQPHAMGRLPGAIPGGRSAHESVITARGVREVAPTAPAPVATPAPVAPGRPLDRAGERAPGERSEPKSPALAPGERIDSMLTRPSRLPGGIPEPKGWADGGPPVLRRWLKAEPLEEAPAPNVEAGVNEPTPAMNSRRRRLLAELRRTKSSGASPGMILQRPSERIAPTLTENTTLDDTDDAENEETPLSDTDLSLGLDRFSKQKNLLSPIFIENKALSILEDVVDLQRPTQLNRRNAGLGALVVLALLVVGIVGIAVSLITDTAGPTPGPTPLTPAVAPLAAAADPEQRSELWRADALKSACTLAESFLRDPMSLAIARRTVGGPTEAAWLNEAFARQGGGLSLRLAEAQIVRWGQCYGVRLPPAPTQARWLDVVERDAEWLVDSRSLFTPQTKTWAEFILERPTSPQFFTAIPSPLPVLSGQQPGWIYWQLQPVGGGPPLTALVAKGSRLQSELARYAIHHPGEPRGLYLSAPTSVPAQAVKIDGWEPTPSDS